jgi:phage baseplate assembly protein V
MTGYYDGQRGMLRRATLVSVDDAGTQQMVGARGLKSEAFERVHRPQPHGFTSVPPSGSEGLLLSLGGRSDRALFLGGEQAGTRPAGLAAGATAIYDASGAIVSLVEKNIRVVAAKLDIVGEADITITSTARVTVTAPRVDLGAAGGVPVVTVAGPSSKVFAVL